MEEDLKARRSGSKISIPVYNTEPLHWFRAQKILLIKQSEVNLYSSPVCWDVFRKREVMRSSDKKATSVFGHETSVVLKAVDYNVNSSVKQNQSWPHTLYVFERGAGVP